YRAFLRADISERYGFAVRRALARRSRAECRSTRRTTLFRFHFRQRRGNVAHILLLSPLFRSESHPDADDDRLRRCRYRGALRAALERCVSSCCARFSVRAVSLGPTTTRCSIKSARCTAKSSFTRTTKSAACVSPINAASDVSPVAISKS